MRWKRLGRFVLVAILVVPAVLLLAFGPRSMQTPPPGTTVVEYWETWTNTEAAALQSVINDFNNTVGKQKHIYVNLLSASDINQKVLASTAAGVPPDIAGMENTDVPQFAELDAIQPLDELARQAGVDGDVYKKVFWDACHYHGKLYALPSTPYDYAMFINQKLMDAHADQLRAAGFSPDGAPVTIDELDRYSKCLEAFDANGELKLVGFLPLEPGWTINYTSYWFGGSWWDAKHERFNFLDPSVVQAFTWIQSYCKRLGKNAVANFHNAAGTFDSPQNPFMAQQVVMEQQGTFMANFIHSQNPSMDGHWRVADFPGLTPALSHVTFCDTNVFTIPRGAKHARAAFEFILYMQQQGPMEKLCGLHCKLSALKNVSYDFLHHNTNPYIEVFDELAAGPLARCAPQCPILPEVVEAMTAFEERLRNLEVTPEQGLQEIQDRLQASLDHFNAIQAKRRALEGMH